MPKNKKVPLCGGTFAVWTGLEPATPCVTGRYSNQAELPDHLFCMNFPQKGTAKIKAFFKSANNFKKFIFFLLKKSSPPIEKHLYI